MSSRAVPTVFIAADFLMTKESEQFSNRRWFKDLLHRPITAATGRAPEAFNSSLTDPKRLSRERFFALSDIALSDGLHFWFDERRVSEASIAYLQQFLPAGSVLVGYELGEPTRRVLERAGVHYVDAWLHPVRFYDDILFGFSSGTRAVYDALKPFHVPDEQFWLYADRLRIQLYKGFRRDETELVPNSALLVGQTLQDKALCHNGRMLGLLDFKPRIEALSREYSRVYFSRHPFVKDGDEDVLKWLQSLPNIELTSVASYHLIANQAIRKVAAVSSSVVHEARFFGKQTEFFYKPVFTFGQRFGKDYLTVYQDLASPHFWAAALAPVMPVNAQAARTVFREGKDKFRDMLAFYWSWPAVDKSETMRQKLNAVAHRVHEQGRAGSQPAPSAPTGALDVPLPELTHGIDAQTFLARARRAFEAARVVSFDVFDTVVQRPLEHYETLFAMLAHQVQARTGIAPEAFVELRRASRKLAESRRVSEEVPLLARYRAVLEAAGVAVDAAAELAALEFETDLRLLQPRPLGVALVELARSMDKRVVFVSDTYYSTEQVSRMLERCGVGRYERLYTSCDEGKLKHSGALFAHVAASLEVAGADIVHVGDNAHSDQKRARDAGWRTLALTAPGTTFEARSLLASTLKFAHAPTHSLVRGLIAQRFHDVPGSGLAPTWCEGDAERFGYSVAGPLFAGFALWVARQAREQGIERLYFLARDGDIVKRVYDRLAPRMAGAPTSRYLLASRRSVNVAGIRTLADALALLRVNFTPCPVGQLLRSRFGLESAQLNEQALAAGGYASVNEKADFKAHQERLATLVSALWPTLQASAREEREALLAYYRDEGLLDAGSWAVVDIGHNGTMQSSLAALTASRPAGLYFATYSAISELAAQGLAARGYVAEQLSGKATEHPYAQFLLMFEMLFLNSQGSFVKMLRQGGALLPVHLPVTGEAARIRFIERAHAGAVRFAEDLARLAPDLSEVRIAGDEAIAPYVAMLRSPSLPEAEMLEGVAFENVYSGRDLRFILAAAGSDEESLWKQGEALLARRIREHGSVVHPVLDWLVRRTCSERKWLKYRSTPQLFFAQSKRAPVRWLGRFVPAPVRGTGPSTP